MKTAGHVVLYILVFGAGLIWGFNVGALTPRVYTTDRQVMQEVCDYSYQVENGGAEEACGIAKNIVGEEYVPSEGLISASEAMK